MDFRNGIILSLSSTNNVKTIFFFRETVTIFKYTLQEVSWTDRGTKKRKDVFFLSLSSLFKLRQYVD